MRSTVAFYQGQFLPLNEISISPLDRGFLFGDAVYEGLPVYQGQPFAVELHIERLNQSLAKLGIAPPYSVKEWENILLELAKCNSPKDQFLYIQVTRGAGHTRAHDDFEGLTPTVFAFSKLWQRPNYLSHQANNVLAHDDTRWQDTYIKSTNLLPNVLLKHQAKKHQAEDTLLFGPQQQLREATTANVFIVKDGTVYTPGLSRHILPGITRKLTIDLCRKKGVPLEEIEVYKHDIETADELWLTSTTREIMPISHFEGKTVGMHFPGPMWQTVYQAWQENLPV